MAMYQKRLDREKKEHFSIARTKLRKLFETVFSTTTETWLNQKQQTVLTSANRWDGLASSREDNNLVHDRSAVVTILIIKI